MVTTAWMATPTIQHQGHSDAIIRDTQQWHKPATHFQRKNYLPAKIYKDYLKFI